MLIFVNNVGTNVDMLSTKGKHIGTHGMVSKIQEHSTVVTAVDTYITPTILTSEFESVLSVKSIVCVKNVMKNICMIIMRKIFMDAYW